MNTNLYKMPMLDLSSKTALALQIDDLRTFFVNHPEWETIVRLASQYEDTLNTFDPFIQSYTSRVCPSCGTVCCQQQYGLPEFGDLVAFIALDFDLLDYDVYRNRKGMCQFMGKRGCMLQRSHRPYRCTWYFCDALLVQIEIGPPEDYKFYLHQQKALIDARTNMLNAFGRLWRQKKELRL